VPVTTTDALTAKTPTLLDDALQVLTSSYAIALPDPNTSITVQYYSDESAGAAASIGTSDGLSLTLRINPAKATDGSGNLNSDDSIDRPIAHEMMKRGLQKVRIRRFINSSYGEYNPR